MLTALERCSIIHLMTSTMSKSSRGQEWWNFSMKWRNTSGSWSLQLGRDLMPHRFWIGFRSLRWFVRCTLSPRRLHRTPLSWRHDGELGQGFEEIGCSMNQVLLLDNRSMSYHFSKKRTESLFRISLLIGTTRFSCKERTPTFFVMPVLWKMSEWVFRQSFAGSLKNTSTHRYV
jgi:hypothetical protein